MERLRTALEFSRSRDALTLWHLLTRTSGVDRLQVIQTFEQRVHLPLTVSRQALLAGDRKALNEAWDALELGSTTWWRSWKREW